MQTLGKALMAAILVSAIPGCVLEEDDVSGEGVEDDELGPDDDDAENLIFDESDPPHPEAAVNQGTEIGRGEYLRKGDYLSRSMSGYSVQLIMQQDGNLVLKRTTGLICWSTGTAGRGRHAVYQRDGNFVVVNSSGGAIWASNTRDGGSGESGQTVSISVAGVLWVGYKRIRGC
jgi:hypothetical protein